MTCLDGCSKEQKTATVVIRRWWVTINQDLLPTNSILLEVIIDGQRMGQLIFQERSCMQTFEVPAGKMEICLKSPDTGEQSKTVRLNLKPGQIIQMVCGYDTPAAGDILCGLLNIGIITTLALTGAASQPFLPELKPGTREIVFRID